MKFLRILVVMAFLLAVSSSVFASSDTTVWQGQYYTGTTFNVGTYAFVFTVYDAPVGGTFCYVNASTLTTGAWGQWYSEQLGVSAACNDPTKDYYLNININGVDQPPRRRINIFNFLRKNSNETTSGSLHANTSLTLQGNPVAVYQFGNNAFSGTGNFQTTGNVTANFFCNSTNCYPISSFLTGSGSTYNATYDLWAYNQTAPAISYILSLGYLNSSYNATYNTYAYNQTTPAIDYILSLGGINSTYNATYDLWAYNQTTPAIDFILSLNYSNVSGSSYNATYDLWAYNQTTPAINYCDANFVNFANVSNLNVNSSVWWGGYNSVPASWTDTYNSTYNSWAYNQTTPAIDFIQSLGYSNSSYNATYNSWAYNQTVAAIDYIMSLNYVNSTYNATYDQWAYNQTVAAIDYIQSLGYSNSTFNSTYDTWAYNQTTPAVDFIQSLGYSNSSYNATYDSWAYNQTVAAIDYIASLNYVNSTYNATYDSWAYNQTVAAIDYIQSLGYSNSTYNSTYNTWAYNQTVAAIDYIASLGYLNSTYNSTYDTWAYNQTTPAIDYILSLNYSNSTSSYNSTYDTWSYNQTTPAILYCDANFINWANESDLNVNSSNSTIWWAGYSSVPSAWTDTYNSTYNSWAYNQTIPAMDYADGKFILQVDENYLNTNSSNYWDGLDDPLASWTDTYNATYNTYAYNQTTAAIDFVQSLGYVNSTYNSTYNTWAYNQTTAAIDYVNAQNYINSTYNSTYDAKADYQFGTNSFNGSGNFTTTGNITAGIFVGGNFTGNLATMSRVNVTGGADIGANITVSGSSNFTGDVVVNKVTASEVKAPFTAGFVVLPTRIDNGNGTITFGDGYANLYDTLEGDGYLRTYYLTGGTTGTELPAIPDGQTSYIVADYNGGSPIINVITNRDLIHQTNVVPLVTVSRVGNSIYMLEWQNMGLAAAEKINDRLVRIYRYSREAGLVLGESFERYVTVTSGVVWFGTTRISIPPLNSSADLDVFYHNATGSWVKNTTMGNQWQNKYYDNGTGLVELNTSEYAINWVYIYINNASEIDIVVGSQNYSSIAEALFGQPPATLPFQISSNYMLIGRIIFQANATSAADIGSVFTTSFTSGASASDHNALSNLEGGGSGSFYHLSSSEYQTVQTVNSTYRRLDTQINWSNLTAYPTACSAGQYVSGFNGALNCSTPSTTNSTYNTWAYNQTTPAIDFIQSFGYLNSSYNATYDLWAYNQTSPAILYCDATFLTIANESNLNVNHSNSTTWWDGLLAPLASWSDTYNATYNTYAYNQTIPALDNASATYISKTSEGNLNVNHSNSTTFWSGLATPLASWTDTTNSTYNLWAYNQTIPALDNASATYIAKTSEGNLNVNSSVWWSGLNAPSATWTSTFNSTYDLYAYNQTLPALANASATYISKTAEGNLNVNHSNSTTFWAGLTAPLASWIDTTNATYNAKADYAFDGNNFLGTGNFTTTTGNVSAVNFCDSTGCSTRTQLLSTFNSTYDAKADYAFGSKNFSGTGDFTTTGNVSAANVFLKAYYDAVSQIDQTTISVNVWQNITLTSTQSGGVRAFHYPANTSNVSIWIQDAGVYDVGYIVQYMATSNSRAGAVRVMKNGAELPKSYFELGAPSTYPASVRNQFHATLAAGDRLELQWVSNNAGLWIQQANTWGTNKETAVFSVRRIG
jgi:hypothetical protein